MGKAGKIRKRLARLGQPYDGKAPNSFGNQHGAPRFLSPSPYSSGLFFNGGVHGPPQPLFHPRGAAYGPMPGPVPHLAPNRFNMIPNLHRPFHPHPNASRMFFRPPSHLMFGNGFGPTASAPRPPPLNSLRLPPGENGFRGRVKKFPGTARNFPPHPPSRSSFSKRVTAPLPTTKPLPHSSKPKPTENIDFSADVVPEMGFTFGQMSQSSRNDNKAKVDVSSTDGNISRSMAIFGRQIPEDQVIAAVDFYLTTGKKKKKLKFVRERFPFVQSENDFKNLQRYATDFGTMVRGPGPVSEAENKMLIAMYATTLNMLSTRAMMMNANAGSVDGELHQPQLAEQSAAADPQQTDDKSTANSARQS